MRNTYTKKPIKEFGSTAYIICNNREVEECEVIRETGDMLTLKILSTGQGTRLRKTKAYHTEGEAKKALENGQ